MKLDTKLIHAGEPKPLIDGAITIPIFQSTTYETGDEKDYSAIRYARLGTTPNHKQLNRKLAEIEGAEAGLVMASGMAAISTAIMALVPEGGHIVAQEDLYGATIQFLKKDLPSFGRTVSFFKLDDDESFQKAVRSNTKAIYLESISNPILKVPDFQKCLSAAKAGGWLSFIDNTFASPVNFNPLAIGFDVVLHSATKYLNGHGDVVGGAVLARTELIEKVNHLLNHLGGCMAPYTCYMLSRGLKTLGVRVRAQNEIALGLARALSEMRSIRNVSYPGLPESPYHARAKKYFRGFGGMLAFDFDGSTEALEAALRRLKLATFAPSLGGVETLVTRPAISTHVAMPAEERRKHGINDQTVRVSVGLEAVEDLIEDFSVAFGK